MLETPPKISHDVNDARIGSNSSSCQWMTAPTRIASSGRLLFCEGGRPGQGRNDIAYKLYCFTRNALAAVRERVSDANRVPGILGFGF